jgi:hypothetical protein
VSLKKLEAGWQPSLPGAWLIADCRFLAIRKFKTKLAIGNRQSAMASFEGLEDLTRVIFRLDLFEDLFDLAVLID